MHASFWKYVWILLAMSALLPSWCWAEQIPVRYLEGVTHGFLVLRNQAQKSVATGDLEQTVKGTVVTSRLKFKFADGSIYEETTSFHTVEMLAGTPKPRIVKLAISPEGEDSFWVAGTRYPAKRYVTKVNIGGIAGAVAPLVGKQPPDTYIWILQAGPQEDAPTFLKSVEPLSSDNIVWQIELASPEWREPDMR